QSFDLNQQGAPPVNLEPLAESDYVLHRRFDRIGRLLGDERMEKLFRAHVMIIGVGGVGSWAAESLARSGVGRLTLVDFDDICITNTNRQLHTISGLVGKKKAPVMAERLAKVNPSAVIDSMDTFYNLNSSEEILARKPDFIIDAIDNITAKCHLLATCRARGIKVITAGGSGGRMNPLKVRVADMSDTHGDPLLQQVRKVLRTKHDFPGEGQPFNLPTIFSEEIPTEPVELKYDKGQGFKCVCPQGANDFHSCEKRNMIYGTASFVTGTFGLVAAAEVTRWILES
ncbi:MAG: tRNA threonylcarbamoyladenosine dehydratase, partial [Bdellovibrionales bacterium]